MKSNTVKTITELFLEGAISLDRSAEPLYGSGQAYVDHPAVFPTVDLELHSTDGLTRIVDAMRMEKGYPPMLGTDEDGRSDLEGWYSFHVGLNGFTETGLDSCIDCVVCNTDSGDDGDVYSLDLSREEQQIIFGLLDAQCRDVFGMGCRELLMEAARAEEIEYKPDKRRDEI